MKHDFASVGMDTSIERIKELIINLEYNNLFVLDDDFLIRDIITLSELCEAYQNDVDPTDLAAGSICRRQTFHLSPSNALEQAIYLFKQTGEERIAVISDDDEAEEV